jgi:hypothetical protein
MTKISTQAITFVRVVDWFFFRLLSSDERQYSWEADNLKGKGRRSIFTSAIIDGLKGNADLDDDGLISYQELYDYAYKRVRDQTPNQTPRHWEFGVESKIIIAKNPLAKMQARTFGMNPLVKLQDSSQSKTDKKQKMIQGIKGVDFIPKDDLRLDFLHHHGIHVEHVLMTRSTIPGDKYRGQGEKWLIQLNIGPSHVSQEHVTIYFNINDAKTFKEKVKRSLKGQKQETFHPESIVINPDNHAIAYVFIEFRERTLHIILNAYYGQHVTVIYFSKRDANEFSSKVGESLAGVYRSRT